MKIAIGLGSLLWAGIGDTMRVSLVRRAGGGGAGRLGSAEVARPAPSRREDHLLPVLRAAGLRRDQTVDDLEERLAHIETPITLSIIGCVVNGPGEALMTDLGLTGGGDRARTWSMRPGKHDHTIEGGRMVDHIVELVERRAAEIQAEEAAAKQKQAAE